MRKINKQKLDYAYDFDGEHITKYKIKIAKNYFAWPTIKLQPDDSLLLKLNIKQKPLRITVWPQIELQHKDKITNHHLERHNHGNRYLNITRMAHELNVGNLVKIRSKRLSWSSEAELIVFHNSIATDTKTLIISPHPDDAELAAFGFYSAHNSLIATITAGEGGDITTLKQHIKSETECHHQKGIIRTINSITVPLHGGVTPQHAVNLGYFDASLDKMYQHPEEPVCSNFTGYANPEHYRQLNCSDLLQPVAVATWNNLVNDLKRLIAVYKPDIIITPHPLLDKHLDHRFSSLAVFQALEECGIKQGQFLFYVVHSKLSYKYPYGPIISPINLPPNYTKLGISSHIYSYSLTAKQQLKKALALDAMFDLRATQKQLRLSKRKENSSWNSYQRKFIRDNELFFCTPFSENKKLIELVAHDLKDVQ